MNQPLPSEMYAVEWGVACQGDLHCHWCGASCGRQFLHGEPPPNPFQKIPPALRLARHPGSPHVCRGCHLWRSKRTIVQTLAGKYLDLQEPRRHSWLLTTSGCFALTPADGPRLYPVLLNPPRHFALSLLVNGPVASGILPFSGSVNHLQHMLVNDTNGARADTPLTFTVNGVSHTYTTYELEEAIRTGKDHNGKVPGVRTLLQLLGTSVSGILPERNLETRGRTGPVLDGKITIQPLKQIE